MTALQIETARRALFETGGLKLNIRAKRMEPVSLGHAARADAYNALARLVLDA